MKKLLLALTLFINVNLLAQQTYVPDDNFEQALIDFGYDSVLDDYVTTANISSVTFLNVSSLNISDLTGIEDFTSLVTLYCHTNILTSLNVTQNTALIFLTCSSNLLTSLNVTQNTVLQTLWCDNNLLNGLDVTQNTVLETLDCRGNTLTSLDVSNNTVMTTLYCNFNSLSSLDVTQNIVLENLACVGNSIGTLDLSNNTALTSLNCINNSLTTLDVSNNTALTWLSCGLNSLISLNVKNGNNSNVTNFDATNNPSLTCIEVDDVAYSTANWTNIDAIASYSTSCNNVYIPDSNFKAYLVGNTLINTNGDTEIQITEANSFSGKISCISLGIIDLTGIEAFTSLTELLCYSNLITSLDVSNLTDLTLLNCSYNSLTSLDVSNNINMTTLWCENNLIVDLDVSSNTLMTTLFVQNNSLISLNVRNGNNNFTNSSFNALNNPDLFCILAQDYTYYNSILTNRDSQSYFDSSCAQISVPDDNFEQELINLGYDNILDDKVYRESINTVTLLDVSNKNISDLRGIKSFSALTQLDCSTNLLTNLSIYSLNNLSVLNCNDNLLTNLSIDSNSNLLQVFCNNNQLSFFDVSNNTLLQIVDCNNNQIIDLDLSQNTALSYIDCSSNSLQSLNIQNGNNTAISPSNFDATNNLSLTCIEVDDVAFSTTNWTNIDATANYSINCHYGETFVPDDNFEQALIDLGYDTVLDDYVTTINVNGITTLDISANSITDLTGIEDFYSLENLNCSSNLLTTIDISQNGNLLTLNCSENDFTGIDTSNNIVLETLNCSQNTIASLDLSLNTLLSNLDTSNNNLTNLNLSNNTNLTSLNCSNNQIGGLVLITNSSLASLDCSGNLLTGLILTNGNNSAITTANFNSTFNASLTCIEVDDEIYSTTNWTNIDFHTSFSNNCHYGETYVPDDNFEQELINLGYDTVLDDYVFTTNINTVGLLDVSFKSISDLTGIEDFTSLTQLICNNNTISSLDLGSNNNLAYLNCSFNVLTDVSISSTSLNFLSASNNQLLDIDLSSQSLLTFVELNNNSLFSLNIKNGNNTGITTFNIINNPNLFCVQVDDVAWSTTNWTNKDTATMYSSDCIYPSIWRTNRWINGTPTLGKDAIIDDEYNTGAFGNINAYTLVISNGKTVIISPNSYIRVNNDMTVNGDLIINHEGSFIQANNFAIVTNNGSIQVQKDMTSFDAGTDFAILGSPMTNESRNGVYFQNNVTMNHLTNNFVPNVDVGIADPLAENFADDNGDNWQFFTGSENIIPGAGYLVGGITGGGNFTSTYTQGTLNNGIVNFPVIFNGSQNASPNILSNPYASAIDGWQFIFNNSIVDAVYFWEHLTPPTNSYPGYRNENWDMGDISIVNLSGGIAASNGGSTPTQFIPSGQGFGIKANASGVVTFDNAMRISGPNTGYRNSENVNRMYVNISNETYGLKSSTLIAFTPNATDGIEASYDAKRLATPISIFSIVEEQELAIQGRSTFNEDQVIPLGFRTQVEELQEYTISLGLIEGEEINNATVYVFDNLLQIETSLSGSNYSFTSEDGNFSDRFIIYFRDESLGVNEFDANTISLYPNPVNNQLNIVSRVAISTITIFDLSGREVRIINTNEQTSLTIDLSELSSSIYFVEIKTQKGSIVRRIIKE